MNRSFSFLFIGDGCRWTSRNHHLRLSSWPPMQSSCPMDACCLHSSRKVAPWPKKKGCPCRSKNGWNLPRSEVFLGMAIDFQTLEVVWVVNFWNRLDTWHLTQLLFFALGYKRVVIVSKGSDPATGFCIINKMNDPSKWSHIEKQK